MQLGRNDLAGKTGTTNDQRDAWFAGYQSSLVAIAWIGFDQPRSLGSGETGAHAALPIWMKYMGSVLKGVPQSLPSIPSGVVQTTINPLSGLPVSPGQSGVPEYFDQESVPMRSSTPDPATDPLSIPGETPDASKPVVPAETKPADSASPTP